MATGGLTPIAIGNMKPKAKRYEVPDRRSPGLYIAVQPGGGKSFAFRYRRPMNKKPAKLTLGRWHEAPKGAKEEPVIGGPLSLAGARKLAADAQHKLKQGIDPGAVALEAKREKKESEGNTLRRVAEDYLRLEGGKLRTGRERRLIFERTIFGPLGGKPIGEIRRSDVVKVLDKVEAERGPRSADDTLAALSKLFRWWAIRDESFNSCIVPGMRRSAPAHERARTRILDDDELRHVWVATSEIEARAGAFVRLLLLTAARRSEVAAMRWSEIAGLDWVLPATRNKTKVDLVRPLSAAALAVLADMPRIDGRESVFWPSMRFASMKKLLDERSGVRDWVLHDLRRTARSLMSRAGVNADHAERCLGHTIGGVRGTYDRYAYYTEKKHAFEALAAQIERIVSLPSEDSQHILTRISELLDDR